MKHWKIAVAFLSLCLASQSLWAQSMPRTTLSIGMYRVDVEVAATQKNREIGLMNRKSLPPFEGMFFVFDAPQRVCMWMKNTLIPLSVAFLDEEGKIINIEDMQPQTENNHCAARPARYALEMNLGWFKSKGFGEGTKIEKASK